MIASRLFRLSQRKWDIWVKRCLSKLWLYGHSTRHSDIWRCGGCALAVILFVDSILLFGFAAIAFRERHGLDCTSAGVLRTMANPFLIAITASLVFSASGLRCRFRRRCYHCWLMQQRLLRFLRLSHGFRAIAAILHGRASGISLFRLILILCWLPCCFLVCPASIHYGSKLPLCRPACPWRQMSLWWRTIMVPMACNRPRRHS